VRLFGAATGVHATVLDYHSMFSCMFASCAHDPAELAALSYHGLLLCKAKMHLQQWREQVNVV
jgi:hypothetical protein